MGNRERERKSSRSGIGTLTVSDCAGRARSYRAEDGVPAGPPDPRVDPPGSGQTILGPRPFHGGMFPKYPRCPSDGASCLKHAAHDGAKPTNLGPECVAVSNNSLRPVSLMSTIDKWTNRMMW